MRLTPHHIVQKSYADLIQERIPIQQGPFNHIYGLFDRLLAKNPIFTPISRLVFQGLVSQPIHFDLVYRKVS